MPPEGIRLPVVVSCEHATAHVPARWRGALEGRRGLLQTHRGHDRGALAAARRLARRLGTRVLAFDVTRLLVDANRAEENPAVFGPAAARLDEEEREALLRTHHRPYRARVSAAVEGALRGSPGVLHVSVHSFTPVLRGRRRPIDVGLLFDPHRATEVALAEAWRKALLRRLPTLRVARNRPYRGWTDGLTTALRRRFGVPYCGVELELNQRWLRDARRWEELVRGVVEAGVEAAQGVGGGGGSGGEGSDLGRNVRSGGSVKGR